MITVGTLHPLSHRKYVVHRDGFIFTATPCYGMHQPWWVVKTMDGEAPPVLMKESDQWELIEIAHHQEQPNDSNEDKGHPAAG